jgi:hypothetical protein
MTVLKNTIAVKQSPGSRRKEYAPIRTQLVTPKITTHAYETDLLARR